MRIIVKPDLRQMKTRDVAPMSARSDIRSNINKEKNNLSPRNIHNLQDRQESRKNLKKWTELYDKKSPHALSPDEKNIMWKKAKRLKDEFTVGMLSTDELHPVKSFEHNGAIQVVVDSKKMRTIHSVDRQAAWENKNQPKIREFKNLMRNLCPDNPSAADIERFRPHKRIG